MCNQMIEKRGGVLLCHLIGAERDTTPFLFSIALVLVPHSQQTTRVLNFCFIENKTHHQCGLQMVDRNHPSYAKLPLNCKLK